MSMPAYWTQLILIVDPGSHRVTDVCGGPAPDGSCPRPVEGRPACLGSVVVPARGTDGTGMAIPVRDGARSCPAAFVSLWRE